MKKLMTRWPMKSVFSFVTKQLASKSMDTEDKSINNQSFFEILKEICQNVRLLRSEVAGIRLSLAQLEERSDEAWSVDDSDGEMCEQQDS